MMTNRKRNHISFIFEDIFISIKSIYIFMVLALINLKDGGGYVLLALVVACVLKSIIKYFNIKYCIENNELKFFTGILNKRKLQIPFNKIHTIDINESLIDRMFNVCTLKIDTGAVKEVGQEVKIKLLREEAYKIRNLINNLNKVVEGEEKEVKEKIHSISFIKKITFKEILLYSLSKSKILWAFGGFFVINNLILNIEEMLNITITNKIIESINIEEIYALGITRLISYGIMLFIILYILVSLIFIVFELIRLFNFTLINDENDIKIRYGLITKKEYSIPRDKISAVRYKQNLLQQLFKIYQIEIVTIGYGDEKNEQAILYPVANKNFIDSSLKEILPNFRFEGNINKPPSNVIGRFIIRRTIILVLFLLLPLYFIIPKSVLLLKVVLFCFSIIFNIILGYLNYRNTALGANKDLLSASNGSILKITTLIKQEYLQSVEIKENPFQRRKYVCDYKLDIFSNKMGDIVILKNLERILINTIDRNLIL